jgi:nucleotide-binding universal stress UspA family protein
MAKCLDARLILLQALAPQSLPAGPTPKNSDLLESAYLHRKATEIKKSFGMEAQWDVLHGEAAASICRYLTTLGGAMLAMTTHGRGPLERALIGSVAGECLRRAGCPLLLHWPAHDAAP